MLPGIGAGEYILIAILALVVIGLFLLWLTVLAWPALGVGGRLIRLAAVGLVVVLGLTRF